MRQLEFGRLKKFLVVTPQDTLVPDEYVAVWMDEKVLGELICWQSVSAGSGKTAPSLSALVAELLEGVGHKP